jgi:hypothetical protein
MKKLLLSIVFLGLLGGAARSDLTLSTSNPPGTPLTMSAGTMSGSMLVNVVSDNAPNDIMAGWQFALEILPDQGTNGTLTFQNPATGMPPNPDNYVFGNNGLGILVTNNGTSLSANDFFNPSDPSDGPGAAVPGSPGASLLQMDFLASSDASGVFGVYALEGDQNTLWTDSNSNSQYFSNVPPDGAGMVRIGEVDVTISAVPEPSTLGLFGLVGAGWLELVAPAKWARAYQLRHDPDQVVFQHPGERRPGAVVVDAGGEEKGIELGKGTGRLGLRQGLPQQAGGGDAAVGGVVRQG